MSKAALNLPHQSVEEGLSGANATNEHPYKDSKEELLPQGTVSGEAEKIKFMVAVISDHFWSCTDEEVCACGWAPKGWTEKLGSWSNPEDDEWLDTVVAPAWAEHLAITLTEKLLDPLVATLAIDEFQQVFSKSSE